MSSPLAWIPRGSSTRLCHVVGNRKHLSPAGSHSLNTIPGSKVFSVPVQLTGGHRNMDSFSGCYSPPASNNSQALCGSESLYGHRRIPGYCPEVLWKRSFANFKFIGVSVHKIPYFCIFIVMGRIYLTLQNGMGISSFFFLFLKSTINEIDHKGFKCQYNIFALEFWVSFSTFYSTGEQNPHI